MTSYSCTKKSPPRPYAYILLVDQPQGYKPNLQTEEYLRTYTAALPTVSVPKGSLVEFDPLCPMESGMKSITVISLDDHDVKAPVMIRELRPLESHEYELLRPLNPQERYDLIDNENWCKILDLQVGDTVWYYRSSKAANVAATSKQNGNFGHVQNSSTEKDVGFVRYIGAIDNDPKRIGFWIGVELFLEPLKGDQSGRIGDQMYFEAPEYSSVFTKVNHLYYYDEEGDIQQIRQKIDAHVTTVSQMVSKPRKKTVWRKFEQDKKANEESHDRIFGGANAQILDGTQQSYDRSSYAEKVFAQIKSNSEKQLPPPPPEKKKELEQLQQECDPLPLQIRDRVVWISDENTEYGVVKWIGHLPDSDTSELVAGIEFDNPIGSGTGFHNNQHFFKSKEGHASFVPLYGLIKAADFDHGANSAKLQRKSQKLVDELELKRRSNSQQQHLADYKMKQNLNRVKNSQSTPSRSGTEDNFSPSILGSLENEVQWTNSSNVSSPSRKIRLYPGGLNANSAYADSSPSLEDNRKNILRQNDLNLIDRTSSTGGVVDIVQTTTNNTNQHHPTVIQRDPYASEEFVVEAEVHGNNSVGGGENNLEQQNNLLLPNFVKLHNTEKHYEEGDLVELHIEESNGSVLYGVIKWIGFLPSNLPEFNAKMAGIELEEELHGATNGWHNGSQLFACADRKAIFVPITHLTPDKRFESSRNSAVFTENSHPHLTNGSSNGHGGLHGEFGDMDCPVVPGFHAPIKIDDLMVFCGRNRGIQGHQNSCYLDATLFAMFSFTSVFDCLLYRPPTTQDIQEYSDVQRVLREEIVNPLRKNWFVRADRVMKLRQLLDKLTSVSGLLSEEKDPEELLQSLLSQTLKAAPFLELSSGQTAHLYQLFVERDESKSLPSVQELFEQSFLTSGIKLKRVPSVLILQMPRFGRQFKVYDRILPSQILDVTDVIEDAPRQCIVCGKLAGFECGECFGEHGEGLDSTAFCETCLARVHNNPKRRKHKMNQLKVPQEYLAQGYTGGHNPRLYMELFAVMCIETSHYVSFVKCGLGPDAPWCFFDSMADRKGEQHGYNIPEVTSAPNVSNWLTEEGVKHIKNCHDDKMLPDHAKRLICDGYMCFYQSPQVMMYQ